MDSEARVSTISKGAMKKMRVSGFIPAIVYGGGVKNTNITVDAAKFSHILSKAGHNVIITLNMPDKSSEMVLIKEVQKNVISRDISHIDFYHVSMTKQIEISIPIMLTGEAPGVKSGGVLSHIVREIKVKCLPADIPEKVIIDVSNLQIGHTIVVKDLPLPKNVEILMQSEQIVVNIVSPTILEEVTPGVSAEAVAEPEVISKGKKEVEGEGATEGKPTEAKKEAAAPSKKEEKK